MDWGRPGLEVFPINHNRTWVFKPSKNLGMQHRGRKSPVAPFLEDFNQSIRERVSARVRGDGVPARGRDGFCRAVPR